MKKTLGIILIGILAACSNSESSKDKDEKSLVTVNVEQYYFPFKKDPTIYEYEDVEQGLDGSVKKENSYVKFGLINTELNTFFLASYDQNKRLTDSITMIKKSNGFYITRFSFLNENGGRTKARDLSGVAFPFLRNLNDSSDFRMNYTTPVMNELAKGTVSTSFSFLGLTETPDSKRSSKDCAKFTSKMRVSLKSTESPNRFDFEEKSTVYDKKNLGLYKISTKKADGSIQTKTFLRIVDSSEW